jgi:hypothetical protein
MWKWSESHEGENIYNFTDGEENYLGYAGWLKSTNCDTTSKSDEDWYCRKCCRIVAESIIERSIQ